MKDTGDITMVSDGVETTFAEATAVKALSSHEYEANFHDDWVIGKGKRSSSFPVVCVLRARISSALRSEATKSSALHGSWRRLFARHSILPSDLNH
jgi:hypothetical protein